MSARISLPKPAREWWKFAAAFALAAAAMAIFSPRGPSNIAFGAMAVLLSFLGIALFATSYQYIELSAAGIVGRPHFGFGKCRVAWSEPLSWSQITPQPGLTGVKFTVQGTGRSFFVPASVLNSLEFREAIERFAPADHVLRDVHF